MPNPSISLIIPTYNRLHALCELIESVERQSYEPLEIIIVNDCGEPVDAVLTLYPELNMRVIRTAENVKHVQARIEGLRHATGDCVMFCDDDDMLAEGHIARMAEAIADADFVYSDAEIFDYRVENGLRIPTSRRLFAYAYDPEAMRRFSTFIPSGCLYRRAIHDVIGPLDPEVYHYWDWDLILRAQERCRVKRVPVAGVLYAFAQSGGNLSGDPEAMRPYLDLLSAKHHLGYLPTKNFFTLLEEPDVKSREATTQIVWDGRPIVPRGTV